jgi:hypothetical protein
VRGVRQKFTLEDAIGSHACSRLEASKQAYVTNGIPPSRVFTPLTGWRFKFRLNAEGQSSIHMPRFPTVGAAQSTRLRVRVRVRLGLGLDGWSYTEYAPALVPSPSPFSSAPHRSAIQLKCRECVCAGVRTREHEPPGHPPLSPPTHAHTHMNTHTLDMPSHANIAFARIRTRKVFAKRTKPAAEPTVKPSPVHTLDEHAHKQQPLTHHAPGSPPLSLSLSLSLPYPHLAATARTCKNMHIACPLAMLLTLSAAEAPSSLPPPPLLPPPSEFYIPPTSTPS